MAYNVAQYSTQQQVQSVYTNQSSSSRDNNCHTTNQAATASITPLLYILAYKNNISQILLLYYRTLHPVTFMSCASITLILVCNTQE